MPHLRCIRMGTWTGTVKMKAIFEKHVSNSQLVGDTIYELQRAIKSIRGP